MSVLEGKSFLRPAQFGRNDDLEKCRRADTSVRFPKLQSELVRPPVCGQHAGT